MNVITGSLPLMQLFGGSGGSSMSTTFITFALVIADFLFPYNKTSE